ncbi:PAS domain S-box protein [Nostocaceae cyanobacterium CENA357]|uniref:Circadian input-output histidine kinase CikA n=1 Tax=Atlanticothrix silvestris CENA357 TaxID=1725252 RepID=A0A8J7HJZ9_9CYAN|nr:ATP-binding protein [Atlanticothrix silvestris]MBH8553968.1 PAS domain S-box protein [Atlanticothrix silvestris CENA357]
MSNVNRLRSQDLHNLLVVQVASAIAIAVGGLVLLGRYFGFEFPQVGFFANPVIMKANTALCFLLSGISLWLSLKVKKLNSQSEQTKDKRNSSRPRVFYLKLSRLVAAAVGLIALLTLVQYVFRLFGDFPSTVMVFHPELMGLNTALNFILLSRALELQLYPKTQHSYWYAQIFTAIAAVFSLQAVIGHAYNVQVLYGLVPYTRSMELYTALTFIVLCVGILWVHTEQGFMRVIMSDTYGGLLARRLLIAAIAVPFWVGWLIVAGQQAGHYSPAFAVSIFAIVLIVIFVILVWQSAAVIERLSRQNDQTQNELKAYEEKLRSFVDANVIGILFADVYGGIQQANDEFLGMIGYTREDLLAGKLSWNNITPPEFLYLDEQSILEAKANAKGTCTPYEKEYIRQDGSRIPVLVGYVLLGEKREESVAFILDLSERRQAKEQIVKLNKDLQRRVTEFQTLLEVIPVGIGIAEDPECKNIKVNPAFANLLGISPNINASLSAPSHERPTNFKVYREGRELSAEELPMQYSAAHGVECLNYELDIVHENGKIANLLEYVAPLFDEEGNTRGSVGAFLDITERKQAESILRNHHKWLEDVLNLMPMPLLFIEPGTARVTFANRAADEVAGGKFPQDIPAEKYHTVYYCTDAAGERIPNEQMPGVRVARGERLDGVEIDWHTPKGVHSLHIFADSLPAMHGYPATCVLAFQDITNLKEVEKALSLGYKRLQLLFSTANDLLSSQEPVALLDSVFQKLKEQIGLDIYLNYLVEDNSQVMRLTSYTGFSEELAKKIEWLKFGQAVCGAVAQGRCPISLENVQQSTDPKTELIRSLGVNAYYSYPLIAQGQLLGTLSFGSRSRSRFSDNQRGMMQAVCDQIVIAMERANLIASLQRQTEQLSEANRMKDEFLAILSHELRSPLNAILGWAQLLRARKLSETQTAKALETIERNARAQTQLIEDLLDISRMIRGKLRLNVRTCDLVPLIESAIETVNLAAQAKEIDLRLELNQNNPESESGFIEAKHPNSSFLVSGDIERLQQIIWNLLSNAIKFTNRGGKVKIRLSVVSCQEKCQKTDNYAQIQVIDTGVGITEEFLPYVFDRFRQADSSSTRSHGGLGLGLAIVRHLVELHGGSVDVDSQGENKGATFTVKLPLLLPTTEMIVEPKSTKKEGDFAPPHIGTSLLGVRVLVVDDEADTREFILTVLQQCQAEVRVVASVQEALQLISQWKPDVLVSDIGMPEEDGYSLIRKLRSQPSEQGGNIPAAALTAYARVEDRMRAIKEGYQLHLPKPIEPAELATVVASLVGRT